MPDNKRPPMSEWLADQEAQQAAGTAVAKQELSLPDYIRRQKGEIEKGLPKHVDADRFIRLALTSVRRTPKLLECTRASVLAGVMEAAQLGLDIDAVRGQAYLIPRRNGRTGKMEAGFQLGYKGLIDLAGRGNITVEPGVVYEKDEFAFEHGTGGFLRHVPALRNRGDVIAYYAIARFPDGRSPFLVMGYDEMEEFRDKFASSRYKGQVTGPWVEHFDAMAKKTVIRALLNYQPLPVQLTDAFSAEDFLDAEPERALGPAGTKTPGAEADEGGDEDEIDDAEVLDGDEEDPGAAPAEQPGDGPTEGGDAGTADQGGTSGAGAGSTGPGPEASSVDDAVEVWDCDLCQGSGKEADGETPCEKCGGSGTVTAPKSEPDPGPAGGTADGGESSGTLLPDEGPEAQTASQGRKRGGSAK